MLSIVDLKRTAVALARERDKHLELADCLRRLQERDKSELRALFGRPGLGKRKIYCLLEISRGIARENLSKSRLRRIGWTKTWIANQHLTRYPADELLDLAENCTVSELKTRLQGGGQQVKSRCVLLYFSPSEYKEFEKAVLRNGGVRSGRGLLNKERAVLSLVRRSMDA